MQQRLMWISGAVLVIGVAVFLGVYFSRGTTPVASTNISNINSPPPTDTKTPAQKHVKPSSDALGVARTFLTTAVQRQNPDASYAIVGPYIKGGLSLKQWRTGNIPVTPFPADNAKTTKFIVRSSTANQIFLDVILNPRKGSGLKKPQAFKLELDRMGGKWLVNSFAADYTIPLKVNPNN